MATANSSVAENTTKAAAAKKRAAERDSLVRAAAGKGWQLLTGVANQNDTVRLLQAAGRRTGMVVDVTPWPNSDKVTFRVTRKAVKK